ncbi:MAG: peptide deformylase [Rhodospirillales bacterium]|nr:peptide deformylase [Rhodospirillales bacterium]
MARLPILTAPDPRLKMKAHRVEKVDDEIKRLMEDMLETMYAAPGIGLAAPQVGVLKSVITVDISREGDPRQPLMIANPEILWVSDEDATFEEGCLSVPEHYAEVVRPKAVRVRYLDHENEIREMDADGMLATVIQHEMDHLDGVLFIDRLSSLRRNMILRKLVKAKKVVGA